MCVDSICLYKLRPEIVSFLKVSSNSVPIHFCLLLIRLASPSDEEQVGGE